MKTATLGKLSIAFFLLCQTGCSDPPPLMDIPPNTWTKLQEEDYGARRFSSFRYAADTDAFVLWGFQAFESWYRGSPETPWDENQEYDVVIFRPETGRWENHFPFQKVQLWSQQLPPMYPVWYYHGITSGGYRPELKERDGILRPDLNIVSDQVTYDSRRSRMVYFTGGRTFAYDVVKREWSDIGGELSPPPVSFGTLCYDPFSDRIILAGGGHVAEPGPGGRTVGYTGTWVYDCASQEWKNLVSQTEPPPRMSTRLVCDTSNQVMVLFGGDRQSRYLSDTWIFDLKTDTWKKSSATVGPQARAGHFTVYDSTTAWMIIGGGYNQEDLTDMWAYEVSTDRWLKLKGEVPVAWYLTADIVPDRGLIVMTTATKSADHTRSCDEVYTVRTTYGYQINREGIVDDSDASAPMRDILKRSEESSTKGTESNPAREEAQSKRIRNMPVNQWVEFANPGREAPIRTWGSCAFDTAEGRLIYWGGGHCGYGGNDYDLYDVDRHTWLSSPIEPEYPERAWNRGSGGHLMGITFGGAPWTHHGRKIYAYDPVTSLVVMTKTVILTAGYEPETLQQFEPIEPEPGKGVFLARGKYQPDSWYKKWVTWTYNPGAEEWEILCPAPEGLDLLVQTPKGVMGVDHYWRSINREDRQDMVDFRGKQVVENSLYLLEVENQQWVKLTQGGPWPQNLYEMTALVYDSKRDQIILHGGGPDRDELWRSKMGSGRWERIETRSAGPACNREAVYLPSGDLILTTGSRPGEDQQAFWVYHIGSNRWQRVSLDLPEGVNLADMGSQNRAWAYDPIHNLVLMVLGEGNQGNAVVYGLKYDDRRSRKL
jgi:hypothetical protein